MIVDVEHHWAPEEQWRKGGGRPGKMVLIFSEDGKEIAPQYDARYRIDKHLEYMDAAGIDMAILSGFNYTLEDSRTWNDECAKVIQKYPKRFAGFAFALPLCPLYAKEALEETERAVKELGMKGVMIRAQVFGRQLDSRELWPFYEKVSELGVPIFVHPSSNVLGFEACNAPYDLNETLAREFELATAATRLCLGGVLEEFPTLKFILAHYAGGLFAIKERFNFWLRYWGARFWYGLERPPISEPYLERFNEHFDKLYFDMAGRDIGMGTIRAALNFISPQRILFATDWPPNFIDDAAGTKTYIEKIRELDLDKESIDGMLGGNAVELLGL